jgi:hypothetical protein
MQEKINKECERKCYDFDSFKMVHTKFSLLITKITKDPLKKREKEITVLLLMTVSWPHTFREEQTESFHERTTEKSICI